mmetsp:Transcript_2325/g.3871  ORF Transcript_2325/g.3871 Transcript_2325/m.3871 type:complete len:263 (+) Transcript_2325:507-1295(+)|eukprot:CAMPEP_0184514382 /NCGR_PEP_ID=MMETSP0198_2-20121128/3934_1 /TAXON_ID=1112570 /ORGANISM="Thraustochytrium sp., Strain LLF1b" /LENGTH=262 /DNA_ID=CAMNT_0026904569 /DNA_START=487 /DNA_END=1275 /DNA_ORIENTATION=-
MNVLAGRLERLRELEKSLEACEDKVTLAHVSKFKADYDADLRKEHPSLHIKFQYGLILSCSPNRGLIRRGIEMLGELQALLQHEHSSGGAFYIPSTEVKKCDAFDDDYVLLENEEEKKENDDDDDDNDASELFEEEAESLEGQASEVDHNDRHFDGKLKGSDVLSRLLLSSLGGHNDLLGDCIFARAIGLFRLGEFRRAMMACDQLLEVSPKYTSARTLRDLSQYGMVSRGALGIFLTVGIAVPAAYLLHKNGGVTRPSSDW